MSARADGPLVAVLAAGLASRFGGGKLDAALAGKPLGQWVLDCVAAAGLAPGVIVAGSQPPQFARSAEGWQVLVNPVAQQGLGTSVAMACRQAAEDGRDLLLLLADMPLISPAHLLDLVRGKGNAATAYPDSHPGVPALIVQGSLGPICDLAGERGAGPLLAQLQGLQTLTPPADMLADVDRREDVARVERLLRASGRA